MYNTHVSVQLVFTLCIHIHIQTVIDGSRVSNAAPGGWPIVLPVLLVTLVCLSVPSTCPFHSKTVLSCLLTLFILPPAFSFSCFSSLPVCLDFETRYGVAHSGCLQTHYIAEDVFELTILLLSALEVFFFDFLPLPNQKYWFVCLCFLNIFLLNLETFLFCDG